MKLRSRSGGTLALVAVSCVILIIVGVGVFFLAKILGGANELRHAADSGSLNVAKNAIKRVGVFPSAGVQTVNFGQLGDTTSGNRINLLTFNRAVGHTLLVSLNAVQQNTFSPAPTAIANANTLIQALEGPGSIGEQLTTELSRTSGNQLFSDFTSSANKNSTRMLGGNAANHIDTKFAVAYMEQTNADPQATNIEIPSALDPLVPATMKTTKLVVSGGIPQPKTFIRGYTAPDLGSGLRVVGVPVQPGEQPHLVSQLDFHNQQSRHASFAGMMVPPNAFQSTVNSQEAKSGVDASSVASAKVGSLNQFFPLSMPLGYVEVINGPANGPGAITLTGNFGDLANVLNNELLQDNIHVSGNVFSTNRPLMDDWARYNKAVADGVSPLPPQPPLSSGSAPGDALFDLSGNPASVADAQSIAWVDSGGSVSADVNTCSDANVSGSGSNGQCRTLWNDGNGAFDRAYYGGNPAYSTPGTVSDLMATECAKCRLQQAFNSHPTCSDTTNCTPTGLRVWRPGRNPANGDRVPSGAPRACRVSDEGTLAQLFEQSTPGSFNAIMNGSSPLSLRARLKQIVPTVSDGHIDSIIAAKGPLRLGERAYFYADPTTGQLVFNDSPPPGKAGGPTAPPETPDGTPWPTAFQRGPYDLVGTMVNPPHDMGIHDILYRDGPTTGSITGMDVATWTPSSGFNNFLGRVQLVQTATGTACGFDRPD